MSRNIYSESVPKRVEERIDSERVCFFCWVVDRREKQDLWPAGGYVDFISSPFDRVKGMRGQGGSDEGPKGLLRDVPPVILHLRIVSSLYWG